MFRFSLMLLIVVNSSLSSVAQFTDRVWCFGDSAGITFSGGNATPSSSKVVSRGTSASISDSSGNLILYGYPLNLSEYAGVLYNGNHEMLVNGDSLHCSPVYQDMLIVPFPGNIQKFIVFTINISTGPHTGIYYSEVDMSAFSGQGAVITRNNQLTNIKPIDCITAVKHGNGRDWWILSKQGGTFANNSYYKYLLTPSGISGPAIQNIGPILLGGFTRLRFSPAGTTLMVTTHAGSIDKFEFDRCSGVISNHQHIDQNVLNQMIGNEFSGNGRFFYVSNSDNWFTPFEVYQYDLNAPNITLSKTLVYTDSVTSDSVSGGLMQRGYDGKIYIGTIGYPSFPYPPSAFNIYNQYLSFIRDPDSLGIPCGVIKQGYYLGGMGRSYWGLPNNPFYELESLTGSTCDTLTSLLNQYETGEIIIYPNPTSEVLTVKTANYQFYDKAPHAIIYDISGRRITSFQLTNFSTTISLGNLIQGTYLLIVEYRNVIVHREKIFLIR